MPPSPTRPRALVLLAAATAVTAILVLPVGCLAPPALLPAVDVDGSLALRLMPEGTVPHEIALDDGAALRGFLVPSDPGAPVVLHLHEASGSAGSLRFHDAVVAAQLAELGFASLLLDYSGVGLSVPGDASMDDFERDVHAMWDEAVRLAGDPSRVVLRGTSLGTLGAAALLRDGARPAAVSLVAPIMPDSAVPRMGARLHGIVAGWLASALFRDLVEVDVPDELARCDAPLAVLTGRADFLLDDEERAALEAGVRASGGAWTELADGHLWLTARAHALLPDEVELLRGLLPDVPDADARLARLLARLPADVAARFDEPAARARLREVSRGVLHGDARLAAAFALRDGGGSTAALRARLLFDERPLSPAPDFDVLCDVVGELVDAGDAAVARLESVSLPLDLFDRFGTGLSLDLPPRALAAWVTRAARDDRIAFGFSADLGLEEVQSSLDLSGAFAELRAAGLDDADAATELLRTVLLAQRVPARTTRADDGTPRVEAAVAGGSTTLDALDTTEGLAFSMRLGQGRGRRAAALVEAARAESLAGTPDPVASEAGTR